MAEDTAQRLDKWRSSLLLLAAGSIPDIDEQSFLGCELRGAAIVATMAEVERLLREFMIGLAADVNSSKTEIRRLVPSLRSLVGHPNFESIATSKQSDTIWNQRAVVTTYETSGTFAVLPGRASKGGQPPLDGKTITDSHILRIWGVLGLVSNPFPRPECATSLRRLASLRNDIAHGNQPIDEVLKSPGASARELEHQIDNVELLILNLATELSAYSTSKAYRV